jgi:short-subunit dehydrogenase
MARKQPAKKTAGRRRRVLVTGASSGIGAAFAARLASDGHDVVLIARRRERLQAMARDLRRRDGVEVEVVAADLAHSAGLRAVEAMIATGGAVDLLVNNAGFGTIGPFAALDPSREEEEVRLNVVALLRLTRAALPGMIRRNTGAVINVSSLAAFQPGPNNATYAATKAFVNSFTESLSEELRGSGVRVQVLCPGFTRTEFQERAGIDTSRIPSFAWMSAEAVVDASLAALSRGTVVCIPGFGNQLLASAVAATPRPLVRRVIGMAGRRLL